MWGINLENLVALIYISYVMWGINLKNMMALINRSYV